MDTMIMKKKPEPSNEGLSLIQSNEDRQVRIEKIRVKPVMQPMPLPLPDVEPLSEDDPGFRMPPKQVHRTRAPAWLWKAALGIALIGANAAYLALRHAHPAPKAVEKRVPPLPGPAAALSVNEQALYWTYALFDFDMLRKQYGVPQGSVVDAAIATRNLKELLPKVDVPTRNAIQRYLPRSWSRP
jgi:hypothetical protein